MGHYFVLYKIISQLRAGKIEYRFYPYYKTFFPDEDTHQKIKEEKKKKAPPQKKVNACLQQHDAREKKKLAKENKRILSPSYTK